MTEVDIQEVETICCLPPEHSCTIYCYNARYEPVSGGSAEPGGKGGEAVVVTGGPGTGGDTDRGSDGGLRTRVEGGRVYGGIGW